MGRRGIKKIKQIWKSCAVLFIYWNIGKRIVGQEWVAVLSR